MFICDEKLSCVVIFHVIAGAEFFIFFSSLLLIFIIPFSFSILCEIHYSLVKIGKFSKLNILYCTALTCPHRLHIKVSYAQKSITEPVK